VKAPLTRILLGVSLLVLAACSSTPQTKALLANPVPGQHVSQRIDSVVFHPQDAYQCGPAALAMVLDHSGVEVAPEALVERVYVPARQGAFQVEMLAATRHHRRLPLVIEPRLESIIAWLDAGEPVLVLLNLGLSWYPKWHYAVVIGYDLQARELILHSGLIPNYRMSLALFERTWRRADHWGAVALVPGHLPVAESPGRYFTAASAFERFATREQAEALWRAGVQAWPDSPELAMGLGNHWYQQGDLTLAAGVFHTLVNNHQNYAPGFNNLAHILLELGDLAGAEEASRHALAEDDDNPTYQATLTEVLAAKEQD